MGYPRDFDAGRKGGKAALFRDENRVDRPGLGEEYSLAWCLPTVKKTGAENRSRRFTHAIER